MKAIKLFAILLLVIMASCNPGKTNQILNGNEAGLPDELKGLKIYTVSTGIGSVKVAILPGGNVNSITYPVGKTQQTTIIINPQNGEGVRSILVKEILVENDSIMVIRKK
jgi:hypothetical protein